MPSAGFEPAIVATKRQKRILNQCCFCKEYKFWKAKSDPKFGRRWRGVNYIDAKKKGSGTLFLLASF
jgi:hypothetical protein